MQTYSVILSQSGTDNPTGTENGTITGATFTRTAQGTYEIVKSLAFPIATVCLTPQFVAGAVDVESYATLERIDVDTLRLKVYDEDGNLVDGFENMVVFAITDGANVVDENSMVSVAEAKAWLKITGTEYDEILTLWIDLVSKAIENYTGRAFKSRTVTDEILDGDGSQKIYPFIAPVISIDKANLLKRDTPDDSWTAIEDTQSHIFVRRTNPYCIELYDEVFPLGVQNIKLTYTAGFSEIPSDVLRVVLEMIQMQYNESKYGNDWLGKTSRALNSGASISESLKDMKSDWLTVLDRYRRLPYA